MKGLGAELAGVSFGLDTLRMHSFEVGEFFWGSPVHSENLVRTTESGEDREAFGGIYR